MPAISEPITGNLAKYQVILELLKQVKKKSGLKILDIGCVGQRTLDIWRTVIEQGKNFELFGVDIAGVDYARKLVARKKWKNVKLCQLDVRELSQKFSTKFFDIIVSTQVLEHVRYPKIFFSEVSKVIKPSGLFYLTFDSGHFPRSNRGLRKIFFDWTVNYTQPLHDEPVEQLFDKFNFSVSDKKYFNLHPLKEIHNHKISKGKKNDLLIKWFDYEIFLNRDKKFIAQNKQYFQGIYYKLRRL